MMFEDFVKPFQIDLEKVSISVVASVELFDIRFNF